MQHEGSITPEKRDQPETLHQSYSFRCKTGGDGIRKLLANVTRTIDANHPRAEQLSHNTQIVLAEALNNIEEHGYRGIAGGQIKLKLELHKDAVVVETVDFGNAMPGLELPMKVLPDADVDCADLPEGGFGWFLIHTLAPNPEYKRRGRSNILRVKILDLGE